MVWEAEIDDVDGITNSGGELITLARLKTHSYTEEHPLRVFRDSHGVIGYEYELFVLCAKKYIWGNLVSCHKDTANFAKDMDKKIVMYIGQSNAFYEFDPMKVLQTGKENKRGGEVMINFRIKLGKRVLES